jgi:hypothetical protein
MMFLSAGNYSLDISPLTAKQQVTKAALEDIYHAMSFCIAGQLMAHLEDNTYQQTKRFWALYEQLEVGLNKTDPSVHRAIEDMRIATARELAARGQAIEIRKNIQHMAPLLYIAHYLGCNDVKIRQLNPGMIDSFILKGDIVYV